MHIKIDWLSFSLPLVLLEDETEQTTLAGVLAACDRINPLILDVVNVMPTWKWGSGRAPYRASFNRPDNGISIFLHPALPHALIEISGKGCETLADHPRAADFLEAITPRLTRLDLAADMLTDLDPLDFVAEREQGHFKSHSEHVSESGTTCYIGSRTSNRYARVYRYNPPHERAHLLRCEFVVKAQDAKLTAQAILADGHYAVAKALGSAFGWLHPVWRVDAPTEAELRAFRPERREGKTLFWLADTVAPLLVKLHQEGTIDIHEWFAQHILPKVEYGDRM